MPSAAGRSTLPREEELSLHRAFDRVTLCIAATAVARSEPDDGAVSKVLDAALHAVRVAAVPFEARTRHAYVAWCSSFVATKRIVVAASAARPALFSVTRTAAGDAPPVVSALRYETKAGTSPG